MLSSCSLFLVFTPWICISSRYHDISWSLVERQGLQRQSLKDLITVLTKKQDSWQTCLFSIWLVNICHHMSSPLWHSMAFYGYTVGCSMVPMVFVFLWPWYFRLCQQRSCLPGPEAPCKIRLKRMIRIWFNIRQYLNLLSESIIWIYLSIYYLSSVYNYVQSSWIMLNLVHLQECQESNL